MKTLTKLLLVVVMTAISPTSLLRLQWTTNLVMYRAAFRLANLLNEKL